MWHTLTYTHLRMNVCCPPFSDNLLNSVHSEWKRKVAEKKPRNEINIMFKIYMLGPGKYSLNHILYICLLAISSILYPRSVTAQ